MGREGETIFNRTCMARTPGMDPHISAFAGYIHRTLGLPGQNREKYLWSITKPYGRQS